VLDISVMYCINAVLPEMVGLIYGAGGIDDVNNR